MVAIKHQRFSGYGLQLRSAQLLHEALRMLRVWESQWEDLSYPEGDPRRLLFSSEIPQDWHDARRELAEAVVFHAAMFAGETEADADTFADTPEAEINPFRVSRVRLAAAFCGWKVQIPFYSIEQSGEIWRVMKAPIRPSDWYRGQVAEFGYRELAQAWIDERKPNKPQPAPEGPAIEGAL